METTRTMQNWIAQRHQMLVTMDMKMGRALIQSGAGENPTDEAVLIALHKARYEVPSIPDELRHASRAWLEANGHDRLRGIPWPPEGKLPTRDGSVL